MNRTFLFALLVPVIAVSATRGAARVRATALPAPVFASPADAAATVDTAVFAAGCFWGVEGVYEHLNGVLSAESGYAGGPAKLANYEAVSDGNTGHAEAVRIIFNPAVVSYTQLLHVLFSVAHDPTQLNRQGPDVGTQYRSAVFYLSGAQKKDVESYIAQLTAAKTFKRPIVTEVTRLTAFYLAEDYHQDYMVKHPNQPYIVVHDAPKVEALKKNFPALYRESRSR